MPDVDLETNPVQSCCSAVAWTPAFALRWRRATTMPPLSTSATASAPRNASGNPFLPSASVSKIHDKLMVRNEALRAIGGSLSPTTAIAVPTAEEVGHSIPVTYVPFRNAHFLAVAVSWAEVLGCAKRCTLAQSSRTVRAIPIAVRRITRRSTRWSKTGTKDGHIEIVTPLIAMRKAEIVRLGLELGAPFDLTWSCYSREDQACGVCDSCVLRLRAFEAAGVQDPIPYAAR